MGAALAAVAVSAVMGGLGACGDDGPASGSRAGPRQPAFPRERADSVVRITLRDFGFQGLEPTVKGPKVFFEAANEGPSDHELMVVDEDGRKLGHIRAFKKETGVRTLPLELKPGRYEARCLVRSGERTHAQLGMEAAFTVE